MAFPKITLTISKDLGLAKLKDGTRYFMNSHSTKEMFVFGIYTDITVHYIITLYTTRQELYIIDMEERNSI